MLDPFLRYSEMGTATSSPGWLRRLSGDRARKLRIRCLLSADDDQLNESHRASRGGMRLPT